MSGADTWKKLTEPQRLLLWSLAEHSHAVVSNYAPRKKLEALGLIEGKGLVYSRTPTPTPAGWCALQPMFWKVPEGWLFRAYKEGEKRVVEASRPKERHWTHAGCFERACDMLKVILEEEKIL